MGILIDMGLVVFVSSGGGWATLGGKYNVARSFNEEQTTGGAPLLARFEKACPERQPKGGLPYSRLYE